jgi:hypothetical protein
LDLLCETAMCDCSVGLKCVAAVWGFIVWLQFAAVVLVCIVGL